MSLKCTEATEMHAIGGFFPLRISTIATSAASVLSQWKGDSTGSWALHNARSALHALWQQTRPRRIWMPAYVCCDVASAVPASIEVLYYPLDDQLSPRSEVLSERIHDGDHVLAVDYFGRPATVGFISLVNANPKVGWIQDCAHALDGAVNAWGDWLLYSPRKLFGAPDGGILVARRKPLPTITTSAPTDFSFALPSLARFDDIEETDNKRWYKDYVRAEAAMTIGTQRISRLSLVVLEGSDAQADSVTRRQNYQLLHRRLRQWAFFPEPEVSYAPSGFPVRVKSAATLSRRLSDFRIFAARHWQVLPSDRQAFPEEHRLADELLTLPCDYRYGEREMQRVSDAMLEAMSTGV